MPAPVPPGVIGHNRSLVTRNYAVLPPEGMFPSFLPWLRDASVFYQTSPKMGASFAQGRLEAAPAAAPWRRARMGWNISSMCWMARWMSPPTMSAPRWSRAASPISRPARRTACATPAPTPTRAVWITRRYVAAEGIAPPAPRFGSRDTTPVTRVDDSGRWRQYLLGTLDMAMDFEMNIMGFDPAPISIASRPISWSTGC